MASGSVREASLISSAVESKIVRCYTQEAPLGGYIHICVAESGPFFHHVSLKLQQSQLGRRNGARHTNE